MRQAGLGGGQGRKRESFKDSSFEKQHDKGVTNLPVKSTGLDD